MTITIKDTTWTSNVPLASILSVMTKAEMLKICNKLELYVSPNLKKDETARRVAREILSFLIPSFSFLISFISHFSFGTSLAPPDDSIGKAAWRERLNLFGPNRANE